MLLQLQLKVLIFFVFCVLCLLMLLTHMFCKYVVKLQKEALRAIKQQSIISAGQVHPSWTFQVLPSLYQHSQKVASLAFMSLYVFHCELHQIRTRLRQHFDVTRISSVAFIHNQHDSITRLFFVTLKTFSDFPLILFSTF
jgi:hypothetical protein